MPPRYVKPLSKTKRAHLLGQHTRGVLVLFDIADSTVRKRDLPDAWFEQTAVVYVAFTRLVRALAKHTHSEAPHSKFIGDGLMAFLPLGHALDGQLGDDVAYKVLREVNRFRAEVHGARRALLGGLRLKTVVTLLLGARELGGEYVNRGVDFSFRLEKAARPDRVVVNSQFYEALSDGAAKRLGQVARAQRRRLKGWSEQQPFWALVDVKAGSQD